MARWTAPSHHPAPCPPWAHLEEDGRVLLVDPHQLQVGHGVDAAHGQARQRHDGGQHLHIPAEGDDGEHQGDGQRGGEERPQRLGQAVVMEGVGQWRVPEPWGSPPTLWWEGTGS